MWCSHTNLVIMECQPLRPRLILLEGVSGAKYKLKTIPALLATQPPTASCCHTAEMESSRQENNATMETLTTWTDVQKVVR